MTSWNDKLGDMKHRVVNITEFKAKCLALLEDVGTNGGTITVTKRGRPLATVRPAHRRAWKSPEGMFAGKLTVDWDRLESDTSELWEVVRDPDRVLG